MNPEILLKLMKKNIIVKICPPYWIPKIFAAAAGKVEKWPPSHKNAQETQTM